MLCFVIINSVHFIFCICLDLDVRTLAGIHVSDLLYFFESSIASAGNSSCLVFIYFLRSLSSLFYQEKCKAQDVYNQKLVGHRQCNNSFVRFKFKTDPTVADFSDPVTPSQSRFSCLFAVCVDHDVSRCVNPSFLNNLWS